MLLSHYLWLPSIGHLLGNKSLQFHVPVCSDMTRDVRRGAAALHAGDVQGQAAIEDVLVGSRIEVTSWQSPWLSDLQQGSAHTGDRMRMDDRSGWHSSVPNKNRLVFYAQ